MSDLTLVGDELRLDGETVAVLVPGLSRGNSLRGRLKDAIGDTRDGYAMEGRAEEVEDELEDLRDAVNDAIEALRQGEPAEDIIKALEAA